MTRFGPRIEPITSPPNAERIRYQLYHRRGSLVSLLSVCLLNYLFERVNSFEKFFSFRNSRDRSSSPARKQDKTDRRKSPHGKKSPIKRERSIKREKSPVGRNRSKDRTSAPRDRSPAGKKRSRDRSPGQG